MRLMMSTLPKRYALVVLVLIATAAVVFLRFPSAAEPERRTVKAVAGDIEATVLASGTLEAGNLVNVGTQASGQVDSLNVVLGQKVKRGDLIATIDATVQNNEVRNAAASLKNLYAQRDAKKVSVRLAAIAFKRQAQMLHEDASPRADYESALASFSTALSDIQGLDAQIEQARIVADKARADLAYTRIRAPMDGTVVAIVTREGQTVNSVQQVPTIVKIARLDTMTVKAQISEADVARVKAGQTVYFSLMGEPGRRFTSRLRVVEPVPESMSQDAPASGGGTGNPAVYYNALFDVPNTDGSLRIAMTAQVSIVVASAKNAVLIPIAALGEKAADGTYAVLVRDRNGRTVERAVRAGIRDGTSIEIREGIQAGEEVVLHGDAPSGAAPSPGSA